MDPASRPDSTGKPAPRLAGSSLRAALLRASVFLVLVALVFAAARWTPLADWLQQDVVTAKLIAYRESSWAGPLLVGLFVAFGLFGLPVSPLMFSGAAVFGPLLGWGYNLAGCILGAILSFGAAKWLGGDLIQRLIGPERYRTMMGVWDRHGFWTVFRLRFVPLPFPFINYGAGLAGIPFRTYLAASVPGLAASVGVWTYLFSTLFEAAAGERGPVIVKGITALAAVLALTFLPPVLRRLRARSQEPRPS